MNHQIVQMILADKRREIATAAERHRRLSGSTARAGLGRRFARIFRLL